MRSTRWFLAGVAASAILAIGSAAAQESPQSAAEPVIDPGVQETIDRLEAALAELAALEESWRETDAADRAEIAEYLEAVALLEAELAAAGRGSERVDALHDRIDRAVRWSLAELRESIKTARRPSELPAWVRGLGRATDVRIFGEAGTELPSSEMSDRLEELRDRVRTAGQGLEALELDLRLADVRRDRELAGRIYRLRLDTLDQLSLARRAAVRGWGFSGRARDAIRLELEALEVAIRLQLFNARGLLATLSVRIRGFLAALLAGRMLLRIFVIVLLWRFAQRGRPRVLQKLRRQAETVEDPQRRRWALQLAGLVEALAPWGIFVLLVVSVGWSFRREAADIPFFYLILGIFAAYGIYRLAVDLIVSGLGTAFQNAGLDLSDERRRTLEIGVGWVARAAVFVAFVLWIYALRLGHGVLFYRLRFLGALLVGLMILIVVLRFRTEVREIFLSLRAHGRLASMVRDSSGRWIAILVVPTAFAWLCGRGVIDFFRGLAFSFEQTRSATAFLSRRRLLKVAEQRGFGGGDLEALPSGLREALDERISVEDMEILGGFSGLDQALESAESWRQGRTGGSLLVAAEEGLGKRAWLERFLAGSGDGARLALDRRILSPSQLRAWLGGELGVTDGGRVGRDEVIAAIHSGPSRIVTLEGIEQLFLATVNGYRALAELGPIIDATRRHHFWLLTVGGLAWNHLRAAGKELTFLRRKLVIEPRSEKQIRTLIGSRLERGGFEVSYADLMAVEGRKEDELSRHRLGKRAFLNLLWDFSGGNPQIALHFYLRSLDVREDGSIHVAPFDAPSEQQLADAGDQALFLLAAIMRHGGLEVSQAAITTAYPAGRVEGLLLHLLDIGTVVRHQPSVYSVTTGWRATVLRVLRRKNILVS